MSAAALTLAAGEIYQASQAIAFVIKNMLALSAIPSLVWSSSLRQRNAMWGLAFALSAADMAFGISSLRSC